MIKYIAGPRASGVGLVKHILVRSGRTVYDLPQILKVDFRPEPGCYYTGQVMDWMGKAPSQSLILIRCPMSSLLSVLDAEARKLGRMLGEQEVEFHARQMISQMMIINTLVSSKKVGYFVVRRDGSLREKLPKLMSLVSGEDIAHGEDVDLFMSASSPGQYLPSMIPSRVMRQIHRMGGMYGKFNIDLEVGQ